MTVRRIWILVCAAVVALGVSACGFSKGEESVEPSGLSGHEVADQNNDGAYVQAGGITYQLQISRELNPFSVEDSGYLKGVSSSVTPPTANQLWYGVFLWAKNQHHRAYTMTGNFVIEDTQGDKYYPVKVDPAVNPYAWSPTVLQKNDTFPAPNSTASEAGTQGGLVLFKINNTAYSNRPLTLYILGSNSRQRLGAISLDL